MSRKILVVDDDPKTVNIIKMYLESEGFQVVMAHTGSAALELARTQRPTLIVLDLMLPHIDGLDICRVLRAESDVPIIMLTARTTETDKLLGLNLGADDYVTKPFSPRELVARVRAVLRRFDKDADKSPTELHCRDLHVNFSRHEVRAAGEIVQLTLKEFKLLETLIREPGRVFSRTDLLEKAFGFDYEGMERTIDVHVMNLRKKIEPNPAEPTYVQTVYGVGYKFAEDV